MSARNVARVVTGVKTRDGAGVSLTRVLGPRDVEDFDPFLMLDAFDSRDPADYAAGFPWHPHRGIETVTYLIAGDIEHGDSLGNRGRITGGSCQWMTAGRGILHQEMPQPSEHMLGVQLWINLPRKDKMTEPAYNDIRARAVIKADQPEGRVAVIAGEYDGRRAPMQGRFAPVTCLDADLKPNARWQVPTPLNNTVFIYIFRGAVAIDSRVYEDRRALLTTPGDRLEVAAGGEGARLLFLSGRPLKEPVAWGGPIVMNTVDELEEAFNELDAGTFIRDSETPRRHIYP